jgi:hypothetical protein
MEGVNSQPRTRLLQYPAQLVLQDVLTLHGSQFRHADVIVASPPCQAYSYMAMPWKRGKAMAAAIREDQTGRKLDALNALFNACFRIQREACEAAGRHIPMVVENVKGAQPWVGSARAHYGSFYLWGDVGMVGDRVVCGVGKEPGVRPATRRHGVKQPGHSGRAWFDVAGHLSSRGPSRKAASAMIAKIPGDLSRYIARYYFPRVNSSTSTLPRLNASQNIESKSEFCATSRSC